MSGNIFGLIWKNKMATVAIFVFKNALFNIALPAAIFMLGFFKFVGYAYYHKTLPGNNFRLISKNKMAATAISVLTV